MARPKLELEYRCDEDCERSGCPGHTASMTFHSVSNHYEYDNGKGEKMWFDRAEAETIIELFRQHGKRRADTVKV